MYRNKRTQVEYTWKFSDSQCWSSCLQGALLSRVGLRGSVGLGPEVGRGRSAREEAGEQGLEEGVEDKLSAAIGRGENFVRYHSRKE